MNYIYNMDNLKNSMPNEEPDTKNEIFYYSINTKISRTGKFIETESRSMVTRSWS